MKKKRQSLILKIIENGNIETQEELTEKLLEYGFSVTQATISRDIKELRLIKVQSKNGSYMYSNPLKDEKIITSSFNKKFAGLIKDGVINIDIAINLVIVKCYPGMANAVCAAIDNFGNSDIVGTIAGDDTIFIALRNEEKALKFLEEIKNAI